MSIIAELLMERNLSQTRSTRCHTITSNMVIQKDSLILMAVTTQLLMQRTSCASITFKSERQAKCLQHQRMFARPGDAVVVGK